MEIKKISYKGWENCYQLSNQTIKVIVTSDVGPRVVFFGFCDGDNLFYEDKAQMGQTGGEGWKIYGGHRLWQAPEVPEITYTADNYPVLVEDLGEKVRFTAPLEITGIQKAIEISVSDQANKVIVDHILFNHGSSPVLLAAWALSVMRAGGTAIVPHAPRQGFAPQLTPTHSIALWSYTRMNDARWVWGEKFVLLKQDAHMQDPQKFGIRNTAGWAAYAVNKQLFVKRFGFDENEQYPDQNCNFEAYTNDKILEMESLGPLKELVPGSSLTHREEWYIHKDIPDPGSEAGIGEIVLPLIDLDL